MRFGYGYLDQRRNHLGRWAFRIHQRYCAPWQVPLAWVLLVVVSLLQIVVSWG